MIKYVTRNKIYRQEFPFNKRSAVLQSSDISYPDHSPFYETGNSNLVFYWRPYEYNVYAVTPASVTRQYSLVFPLSLSLPAGFITDSALAGKRMRYINANKKVIFDLSYVYRLGNSLFFKIGTLDPGLTDNCALVYNMKSGSLLSIAHISPDSSNYFLPLGDIDFTSTEFANDNFYTCDGKYVYTAHSSLQMFRARALTRSKNVKYNQVLKNYFLKEDKDSNPVIIRLRPRENY